MRNYKYSFNQNFIIFWQMELVYFFVLVHPVYSKFLLCDYCYREMKKCYVYLIYDKANGDVAILEWV